MILEYAILFVVAILAGGWAIPAGLLFDLNPLGVYLTCLIASIFTTVALLSLGSRFQHRIVDRIVPDAESKVADGSAQELLDRWGVPGLAVVGGVVLGPTVTILAALFLDVDRRRFTGLYLTSTAVLYALITAFWTLVM